MEIESGKEKRETAQNGTTLLAMYVSTRKNREKKKCKQTVKHTPKKKKHARVFAKAVASSSSLKVFTNRGIFAHSTFAQAHLQTRRKKRRTEGIIKRAAQHWRKEKHAKALFYHRDEKNTGIYSKNCLLWDEASAENKKKEINTKEGTKQLHIREYSKKKEKGEKMNDTKKRELKGHWYSSLPLSLWHRHRCWRCNKKRSKKKKRTFCKRLLSTNT